MSASGMGEVGKKSSTFELNLVPFIDLLSTLICFLLITAVWQKLDVMSSNTPPKNTAEMPDTPQPPPDQPGAPSHGRLLAWTKPTSSKTSKSCRFHMLARIQMSRA